MESPPMCVICKKTAVLTNNDIPYCVKHYIKEIKNESISRNKESTT